MEKTEPYKASHPRGQKALAFEATIRVRVSNVIDPETLCDLYKNDAKTMLLWTFDDALGLAVNADEIELISARKVEK